VRPFVVHFVAPLIGARDRKHKTIALTISPFEWDWENGKSGHRRRSLKLPVFAAGRRGANICEMIVQFATRKPGSRLWCRCIGNWREVLLVKETGISSPSVAFAIGGKRGHAGAAMFSRGRHEIFEEDVAEGTVSTPWSWKSGGLLHLAS